MFSDWAAEVNLGRISFFSQSNKTKKPHKQKIHTKNTRFTAVQSGQLTDSDRPAGRVGVRRNNKPDFVIFLTEITVTSTLQKLSTAHNAIDTE